MAIVNGHSLDDKQGMITRIHTTVKSVVDYVLSPVEHFNFISKLKIGQQWIYSDHRPLDVQIKYKNIQLQNPTAKFNETEHGMRRT